MCIGSAGENLCSFACIMSGNHHAAGRTGVGAVMGSKLLKAMVISGKKQFSKLDDHKKNILKNYTKKIMDAPLYPVFSKYSNSGFVKPINKKGMLCTRNYRQTSFSGADQIDGT